MSASGLVGRWAKNIRNVLKKKGGRTSNSLAVWTNRVSAGTAVPDTNSRAVSSPSVSTGTDVPVRQFIYALKVSDIRHTRAVLAEDAKHARNTSAFVALGLIMVVAYVCGRVTISFWSKMLISFVAGYFLYSFQSYHAHGPDIAGVEGQ